MANKIVLKYREGLTGQPALDAGEVATNLTDKELYIGTSGTNLVFADKTYVDAAVSGLVDAAPGTLDTLNELAAALGDDASFSTTMTNSLANKAPLASPALTGTPTAPTQAAGDNTTALATTAFVQQEISTSTIDGGTY